MRGFFTLLLLGTVCILTALSEGVPIEQKVPPSEQAGLCAGCHLGGAGAETAPQVDPGRLLASAHKALLCVDCHEGVTPTHGPIFTPVDCASCHRETAEGFQRGVHWRELQRRNPDAPGCASCHGTHDIQSADILTSPVNHGRVADTCGGCHESQLRQFERSSHGVALKDEVKRRMAPTCTTCHGEHVIFLAGAPASPASPGRLPRTCGGCHDDPKLAEVLGLPSERLKTYGETIHGLRQRFGVYTVATCADCHGSHLVLPQAETASTISSENIVSTCGRCHPNANENFVKAKIHTQATPESSFGVFAVRWFYIVFIGVLVTGFVLHIAFDLIKLRRRRREARNG